MFKSFTILILNYIYFNLILTKMQIELFCRLFSFLFYLSLKMSTKNVYQNKNNYEEELCDFLMRRIEKCGGSIKLQSLTGHLSGLKYEVRINVGTSMSELKSFLNKRNDVFTLHDNIVSLSQSFITDGKDDNNTSNDESLPQTIKNGIGVIVKLFPEFGFIKTKEPLKTSVYFKASHFVCDKNSNLMNCGLNIGTMVCFNASKEHNGVQYTSKYRATRVWRKDSVNEDTIQKQRKKLNTGLYDPVNLEGEGFIQTVFPTHGFIAVNGDENNTVFFHKKRLLNYDNIVDLTKVLSKGDLIEFSAHRSTKSDSKARWEATKVWKKSIKDLNTKTSENTCHLVTNQIQASSDYKQRKIASQSNIKLQNYTDDEIIRNQKGKISPRSHGAVIKFGESLSQLADGDSCIYFIFGAKVLDISWEFNDGDDVLFDAVKIKSAPGWKAILVWVGKKPDVKESLVVRNSGELSDVDESEILDENDSSASNFLSLSSNSSLKSISAKSGSTASKSSISEDKETESLKYKEIKKSNQNDNKSLCTSSRCSSQNSLSSVDSKVFHVSEKHLTEQSNLRLWTSKEETIENMFAVENSSLSSEENVCDIMSTEYNHTSNVESEECDADLKTALDFLKDKGTSLEDTKIESKNTELTSEKNSITKEASIKRYQNVSGTVSKVFRTNAEIISSELLKPVIFNLAVFYYNKKSAKELPLNLKEVLKIGDTVHFNYFEIVDDSSQNWNQTSMVWKGEKPCRVVELTPEDYIRKYDLSVTIKETQEVYSKKFLTSYEDFTSDSEETTDYKKPHKNISGKSATSFEDLVPDSDAVECISLTESCIDHDETLPSVKQTDHQNLEGSLNDDEQELSIKISEILRSKELLSMDSEV